MTDARFVLATLEDIAPKLAGAKYFSKLDASSGSWQIPLHPESAKLSKFITPSGRFCFKRLPFGITCAREIFQGLMTDLLKKEKGCEAIMDYNNQLHPGAFCSRKLTEDEVKYAEIEKECLVAEWT